MRRVIGLLDICMLPICIGARAGIEASGEERNLGCLHGSGLVGHSGCGRCDSNLRTLNLPNKRARGRNTAQDHPVV